MPALRLCFRAAHTRKRSSRSQPGFLLRFSVAASTAFSQRTALRWDGSCSPAPGQGGPTANGNRKTDCNRNTEIYVVGHPDSPFMASPFEKRPPLALDRFPICFRMNTNRSSLVLHFQSRERRVLGRPWYGGHRRNVPFCGKQSRDVLVKALVVRRTSRNLPGRVCGEGAQIVEFCRAEIRLPRFWRKSAPWRNFEQKRTMKRRMHELIGRKSHLSGKLANYAHHPEPDEKTLEESAGSFPDPKARRKPTPT